VNIASKLILLGLLAIAGLGVWLLPKTRLASRRSIGDKLFVATFVTGILCAAAGLIVLFAWPQQTRVASVGTHSHAPGFGIRLLDGRYAPGADQGRD